MDCVVDEYEEHTAIHQVYCACTHYSSPERLSSLTSMSVLQSECQVDPFAPHSSLETSNMCLVEQDCRQRNPCTVAAETDSLNLAMS